MTQTGRQCGEAFQDQRIRRLLAEIEASRGDAVFRGVLAGGGHDEELLFLTLVIKYAVGRGNAIGAPTVPAQRDRIDRSEGLGVHEGAEFGRESHYFQFKEIANLLGTVPAKPRGGDDWFSTGAAP
ncbi:unnamed protein product [Prorocentrum cordatum]|uniref:Uncharacterized protein n=1 Tax=Prorocentrum cordatum TaxID=2364126 RepID=A0ABN9YIL4_9DINO|nr:unnamed protein product [Polarella glacialis]